jgi:hypothetical protein
MAIPSKVEFAAECVRQGLFLGVNSHCLVADAQLRSGIDDDTQDDRIGPFRVTQEEWDAGSSAPDLEVILQPEHINEWRLQCLYAALAAYRAQKAHLDQHGKYPSAVDLYKAQWPEDASNNVPQRLQTAVDATKDLMIPAFTVVLGEPPSDPTIDDTNGPANPPKSDPEKPIPPNSDAIFFTKAPGIMQRLIDDFGLTVIQAAGVLGNIGHECGGFRLMQEVNPIGGGAGGFGWCQWTGPRRTTFMEFCTTNSLAATSDEANYGYLKKELQTTESAAIPALRATATLKDAVRTFEQKFERAGVKNYPRREKWARLALQAFQG